MRNKFSKTGYATIIGPGQYKEYDTLTCIHCGSVWAVRSSDGKGDPGGWCRLCDKPICPHCAGKDCFPFKRKLYLYERRQDLFKKMGLTL